MDRESILIIYSLIAVRIFLLYISSYVSSNIMNQIYTERVLINGDEPPKLNNQLYLFLGIDIILNLFLFAFAWAVIKAYRGETNLFNIYISQYGITTMMTFIICLIISNMMYMKKFFLYKDDGLRAIRVLQILTYRIGAFMSFVPMFMISS
tara:strand:- start:882 stop:1334 length:453 start_codon:yes stop_codon:yes gene_type:complete